MKVCLGIFARNEADRICNLIHDLGRQTLLAADDADVRILVVANGCSDDTVGIARAAFRAEPFSSANVEVHELDRAGKANAWNELVHRLAPDDTEFLFFLDADIRIPQANALRLVLDELRNAPKAAVAVDRSVKDLELEQPRGISDWLTKAATGTASDMGSSIAGAFYCARFAEVRKIWLPLGLPGEDGFLNAMLKTSSFAHPPKPERHLFVDSTYHVFESVRGIGPLIRHNVRLAIGTAVNILLFHHLRDLRARGIDVADYIQTRNRHDPRWVNDLIRQRLGQSYFPLQPRFLMRRFQHRRSRDSLKRLAIALLGTAFDVVVFARATALMRRGAGAGYW